MNRPIFTLFTGTPTARADAALPPTAKIQLPIRVRVRIHDAMATNSSHHTTVICTVTLPMSNDDAKIAFSAVETLDIGHVLGGDRPGQQLRHTQVRALQDEERAQRDQEDWVSPSVPPDTR